MNPDRFGIVWPRGGDKRDDAYEKYLASHLDYWLDRSERNMWFAVGSAVVAGILAIICVLLAFHHVTIIIQP